MEELAYQRAELGISSEGRREGTSEGGGQHGQSGLWPVAVVRMELARGPILRCGQFTSRFPPLLGSLGTHMT